MRDFSPVYRLPNVPAVYAFYSEGRRVSYVAYVGIAGRLKQRILQHLIRQDSSVATGTSAVNLNPDFVSRINWWEHPNFDKTVHLNINTRFETEHQNIISLNNYVFLDILVHVCIYNNLF